MSTKDSARKFQFIREIASGGFGSVYLAKVIHGDGFSRLVAIKLLHRKWSENEEIASRMRDEARLLGWLRHRNIVDVMDLTMIDGRAAVIMEYLEAVDSRVLVTHCQESGQRLPLRVALEITAAVASALDAAYNRPPYAGERPLRVIHRDIKPSNIMVDASGIVKVLDFGVARAEFDAREAKTAELSFGSLEYMPPERLFFEPESAASDVYSLGTTLYELLALEKLGKARLRQSEHDRFLEERFEDLLVRHPMPSEEAEDILHELLRDMLAFDEADRPTAADCGSRMRSFARTLASESLEEWAERHVPGLVEKHQRAADGGGEESLVGRVVTEEVAAFPEEVTTVDGVRTGEAVLEDEETLPPDEPGDDEEGQRVDDARWSALKEETLHSLSEAGELTPPERGPQARTRPLSSSSVGGSLAPGGPGEAARTELIGDKRAILDPDDISEDAPTVLRRTDDEEPSLVEEAPVIPPSPPAARSVPAPAEVEPEGRGMVGVVVSVVLLGGVGAVLLLAAVIVGAGIYMVSGAEAPPSPSLAEEVTAPAPAEVPADEEPAPELPAEGEGAVFVSELPDTRKVQVRCDGGTGEGSSEAGVVAEAPGDCTVTAVTADRKRRTAVVKAVEPRRYVCFAAGSDDCE